jgi:hypothetical protein
MILSYKKSLFIFFLCVALFLLFSTLPLSLYGQDGYSLWYPIVSEYLRGDTSYRNSQVIFGGQNLGSIYGELPFWGLFRFFKFSIHHFLNQTHCLFIIFFFVTSVFIFNGIRKGINFSEIIVLYIYSILSPVIINRVMAGHLNLIFGVLPFFSLISIVYNKTFLNFILSVIIFWCAMSTQAYQILSYYFFYIPILAYFFLKEEKSRFKYIGFVFIVFISSFFLSFNNFFEMYKHALSPDNLRGINEKMVYSYVTTNFMDLFQFFFSGMYPEFQRLSPYFFHEINYAIGSFAFLFFRVRKWIWLNVIISLLIIFLLFFCMNLSPFNLISELPLIKTFRVPQRSFMIISLFLPLWIFSTDQSNIKRNDIIVFVFLIIFSFFVNYFEYIAIFFCIFFSLQSKFQNKNFAIIFAFAGLFSGTIEKLTPAINENQNYKIISNYLNPILLKYSNSDLKKEVFHFETTQPALVNYVAQSLGIRTIEGYGHPPAKIIKIYQTRTGVVLPKSLNSFYITGNFSSKNELLKDLGVTKIIYFDSDNGIQEKNLH